MSEAVPRGVGVDGTLGVEAVSELAALAEACGYSSFWFNVTAADIDAIATLERALERTKALEIGIGLFPLDTFPAAGVARALRDAGLSSRRIILGVAAGKVKQGALRLVGDAVAELRAAAPAARTAIGGYGPNILALAGRVADAVLANWMTPERLDWTREQVAAGASSARRPLPAMYLYHRAATGEDAGARIEAEMAHYRRFPVHERHQTAMGNPQRIGVVAAARAEVDAQLQPYAATCLPILKPLPRQAADLAEWRALVRLFGFRD